MYVCMYVAVLESVETYWFSV